MLTGIALKETVAAMQAEGKTRSEIAIACGYCTVEGNNTKIHFTDFYMALLEVKQVDDTEEETIEAEDPDNQEAINAALENYSAEAVEAFIELFMGSRMLSILRMLTRENTNQAHTMQNHWLVIATA